MTEMGEQAVEVWKAAELLDLEIAEVYDLVFSRRLMSVEGPNGRRLVPRAAIEAWRTGEAPVHV